jgi:outer membrane receptor for ferrienterochelin and colicins
VQNKKKLNTRMAAMILMTIASSTVSVYGAPQSEEAIRTNDIVVTSTRTEQEVKEIPSAVQVITQEDIQRQGATTLADILRTATSIDINSGGMVGKSVSIRGLDTRHTLILIDGQRLASETSMQTANVYELQRIRLDNVERIEIVRGPVSSLYGSDALGGVINIITKKPGNKEIFISWQPGRYRGSQAGVNDVVLKYDAGKQGNFAWVLTGAYSDSDAIDKPNTSTSNQFGERKSLALYGTYDIGENKQLQLNAETLKEDLQARQVTAGVKYKDWYDNSRKKFGLGLTGKTKSIDYEVRTYFTQYDKDTVTRKENGSLQDFDVTNKKTWAVEGKISTQINDSHLLTTGGEFRNEKYEGTRLSTGRNLFTQIREGVTRTGSQAEIDYKALYVQDEWVVSDRLLVIPSLRYDDSNKFSGNTSPKLGVTYKMNQHVRVKANGGTGFKSPSMDELYMKMTHYNVTVLGNENLQPEKSKSYEVGIEGEKGANFGKVSYFANKVTNLIDTVSTIEFTGGKPSIKAQYVNKAKADMNGIELEAGRHLNDKFILKMNYTYLDAKDATSHERLENRAKQKGSLQLHYDNSKENGISGVLWTEWNKDYLYLKENRTFSLWNVSVNKQWNPSFNTYLAVDNIFDNKEGDMNILGTMWRVGMNFKL